jgi:hypothetical protein
MAFVDAAVVDGEVRSVNLGPLALLRPLLQKINIAGIIDRHLPSDAQFSHGTVLEILLAARLHCPTALVNVACWAQEHGVEYLWNIPPEKLNDDRLARALDAFFPKRHDILADVTHEVLRLTQLTLERGHFDTTHLILYGSYPGSQRRPESTLEQLLSDLRDSPAHISRGYLTRYKMLQLGVTAVVDDLGAVPVACHLFDGNRNGHSGIEQQYQLLRQSLHLPNDFLLISDRGTCSAEHLGRLLAHGHYALCAGQWQDYSSLYDQHADRLLWQPASYLSREQQRRRTTASTLPREEYRLAVVNHQLLDPSSKQPFACRVVFSHSSAADRECKERRQQNIACIHAGLAAIARKLERAHPTTTPQSVARQVSRLFGKKAAAKHFHWQLLPLTETEKAVLPPPQKGYRQQTHRLQYAFDAAAAQAESRHDGIYALVTTAPRTCSGDALFSEYKRQIYVERGHHELKTPLAVTPLFLKTPRRIEALVSLLFLALQAAMTMERLYRQRVASDAPLGERRMTAERLLRKFQVCGISVEACSYGELVRVPGLSAEQRRILNHLSLATPSKILRQILAPPPTA